MAALYICLAHIIRLFEIEYQDHGYVDPRPCIPGTAHKWLGRRHLKYKDYFVTLIDGPHLQGRVKHRVRAGEPLDMSLE
jgi:hypothetical protein